MPLEAGCPLGRGLGSGPATPSHSSTTLARFEAWEGALESSAHVFSEYVGPSSMPHASKEREARGWQLEVVAYVHTHPTNLTHQPQPKPRPARTVACTGMGA